MTEQIETCQYCGCSGAKLRNPVTGRCNSCSAPMPPANKEERERAINRNLAGAEFCGTSVYLTMQEMGK